MSALARVIGVAAIAMGIIHGTGPARAQSAAVTVSVAILSPADASVVTAPGSIGFTAGASTDNPGWQVVRVEYYAGADLIGTASAAPYAVAWTNVTAGTYSITAKAIAANRGVAAHNPPTPKPPPGVEAISAPISVIVNALPAVAINAPANGAILNAPATVELAADAFDSDGTIAKVDFYQGATLVGTATSSPYTATVSGLAAGTYSFTAVATDNNNATTTSAAISVRVNAGPTVSTTSPASGTVFNAPATVNLEASAGDSDGSIAKVEFFQGATLVGTATSAPYAASVSGLASGSYSFTAVATDNDGATATSAAVAITVNAAPSVAITSPANNATFSAPASVAITATATDSDGTINRVELYANANLIATLTAAPYTFNWTDVGTGTYALTAKAVDNNNAETVSATVTLTVKVASTLYFIHPDHLNTPRVVTNQVGQAVWRWDNSDPFGGNPPDENPSGLGAFKFDLRFTGQVWNNETQTAYNYFRDCYDPAMGRYCQSDPIGLAGGINTYAYVRGNPLSFFDSNGLDLTVTYYPGPVVDHIGIGVNSPTTYGLYPWQRNLEVALCRDVPGRVSNDRYVQDPKSQSRAQTIVIKTTPMQDDFVRKYIEDARNAGARRDSDLVYNLCSEQCTRFVIDALATAGVGLPRLDSARPKDLFDILQQSFGSQK